MFKCLSIALVVISSAAFGYYQIQRTKAPKGAKVYIVSPADGAVVSSPVKVIFGLDGMGVAPAGIKFDKTGHHHILVDIDAKSVNMSLPIPVSDHHVHFGGGQTQTTLTLTPGKHSLQLLLGDELHVPHDPVIESEKITITVK